MLKGVLNVPLRAFCIKRTTKQRLPSRIITIWRLLIVAIMLAASLCRCRASFLRHPRHAAFVANAAWKDSIHTAFTGSYGGGRAALLTSYARLQSDDDEMEQSSVPRGVPRSRHSLPPPKARRMPPTLEDDGGNISPEFPEFDVADEFSEYDYDPNVDSGLSYGFFTDLDEEVETVLPQSSLDVNGWSTNTTTAPEMEPYSSEWDEYDTETVSEESDEVEPPIEDVYMSSMQEEHVPSPHNYWDDDTPEETPPKDETPPVIVEMPTPSKPVNVKVKATSPPPPTMPPRAIFASQPPQHREEVYVKASSGDAITSEVDMLTAQLLQLEKDIYAQNNNKEFKIKSTKQVSEVLFGQPGQSTNKETLEAMGGAGNVMADLILQYRSLSRKITRLCKKKENKANGTHVRNVSASNRPRKSITKETLAVADANDGEVEGDPLLLVDASAYIFRAYYSMPPLHRKDGMPVGAVLGFCNMLNRLVLSRMLQGECPRLVLVFDAKGKTFRHDLYDEYKANRPECPMDLIPQFDLIREAAEAYGIQQLEAPYFEADDVIATLATMALNEGVDTSILSGDKDLMQLITPQ